MSRLKQALYAGVALVFWMSMTQMLIPGMVLSVLFLLGSRMEPRFELNEKKLGSIMDGCYVLFFMTIILVWNQTETRSDVFLVTMTWLPMIFSPLFVFLYFSKAFAFNPGCLLFLLRYVIKQDKKVYEVNSSNFVWPLMVLCFLSSSVGFYATLFYPVMGIIVFSILLLEDKRKEQLWKRAAMIAFTLVLGYGMHHTFSSAQQYFRRQSVQWLLNLTNQQIPPRRQWTAIGEHSQIQLSPEIVMRVKTEVQGISYFKGAHFDEFMGETHWFNTMEFESVELKEKQDIMVQKVEYEDQLGELWYQGQGEAWIPLPKTTSRVQIPNIPKVEMWEGQVIRVPPPFGWLHVTWNGNSKLNRQDTFDPLSSLYLSVPEEQQVDWDEFIAEQGWQDIQDLSKLKRILIKYFKTFTYSLDAMRVPKDVSPIFYFMETSKKGHCEHFATAATMILRTLGYRARYCTGYVVREYSEFQDMWLVRGRDAHAWVELWNGQHWERFEPTPPSNMGRSNWSRPIKDRFDWLMFQIDKLRFQGHVDRLKDVAPWGIGIVMLYLMLRMFKIVGFKRKVKISSPGYTFEKVQTGGEILEVKLAKKGFERYSNETWENWIQRLKREKQIGVELLEEIKLRHVKMVYGDQEIDESDRAELKSKCLEYLNKLEQESAVMDNKN